MYGKQEELQFLGILGIYKESYKIVLSWRKIFYQITLSLILPLSFSFLAENQVSDLLITKIYAGQEAHNNTHKYSPKEDKILDGPTVDWSTIILFKTAYYAVLAIFSLLSNSAIVYTIGCICSTKDVTFRKVMSVMPKMWKRLFVTFLWTLLLLLALICMIPMLLMVLGTISAIVTSFGIFLEGPSSFVIITIVSFSVVYVALVYAALIGNLACTVSVLETIYGLEALEKSYELIKGKEKIATAIYNNMVLAFVAISLLFEKLVIHGESLGLRVRFLCGGLLFLFLTMLILFRDVIVTVIYFVCKSYHHENIDKSCLADHLEAYLEEYVPLDEKPMQLQY